MCNIWYYHWDQTYFYRSVFPPFLPSFLHCCSSVLPSFSFFLLLLSFSISFYNTLDILHSSFICRFCFIQSQVALVKSVCLLFNPITKWLIASWLILRGGTFIGKVRLSRHGYWGWNFHYPPQSFWLKLLIWG